MSIQEILEEEARDRIPDAAHRKAWAEKFYAEHGKQFLNLCIVGFSIGRGRRPTGVGVTLSGSPGGLLP